MTTPIENLNILLSREELIFLLYILQVDFFIPGLDPDPFGKPTKEQKDLALARAEHALRARGLATLNEKNELEVQKTLLSMIDTCACPELMISLHHFSTNNPPNRVFWNVRSSVIVAHDRHEAPLHGFSMLKDRDNLCRRIVASCGLALEGKPDLPEISTNGQTLTVIRETVIQDLPGTIQSITSSGVEKEAAKEICSVFAGQHEVSVLGLAAQKTDQTILREAVMVFSGQTSTWLMTPQGDDQVSLKVIDQNELFDLLTKWTNLVKNWPEIPAIV